MNLIKLLGLVSLLQYSEPSPQFSLDTKPHYQNLQKVRVTAYWSAEDYWTKRKLSSSGVRLKAGKHVAVDPRLFPYGTKIKIENWGIYTCVDTGRSVISRKASGGRLPVIDVYFDTESSAIAALRNRPEITYISKL